jgi:hypothetical protein
MSVLQDAQTRFWDEFEAQRLRIDEMVQWIHNNVPRRDLNGNEAPKDFTTEGLLDLSGGQPSPYGE